MMLWPPSGAITVLSYYWSQHAQQAASIHWGWHGGGGGLEHSCMGGAGGAGADQKKSMIGFHAGISRD